MKIFNTGESETELKEKYNPEDSKLRRAQLRMLEMVKYIDSICKENGLDYFLTGGNMLGAVRHGGFIPWDDDFDICVPERDYKKLINILRKGNNDFVLQNHNTDKGHVLYWSELRDTKSEYIKDDVVHNSKKYRGIQVDIFPVSCGVIPLGKKIVNEFVNLNQKWICRTNGAQSGLAYLLKELLYYIPLFSVIPLFKFCTFFNSKKFLSFSYTGCFKYSFEVNESFPLTTMQFEDTQLFVPKNYLYFLQRHFGENWDKLPDPEFRTHHNVDSIIFK